MAGDEVKQVINQVLDGIKNDHTTKTTTDVAVIDVGSSDDDSSNDRVLDEVQSKKRKTPIVIPHQQFWESGDFEGRSAAVWDAFSVKHGSASVLNMAGSGSSSSPHLYPLVDDFYFSVLHGEDEIFPISDEKYAEALQLQEALISSSTILPPQNASSSSTPLPPQNASSSSTSPPPQNGSSSVTLPVSSSSKSKQPLVTSEAIPLPESFCGICMDTKLASEMFRNINVCGHSFCLDCIRSHVATKIKENITRVKCPNPNCRGEIGPELCRSIVPKEVLDRWEDSLCENVILASQKFYCPFKDCSAMLVDDGGQTVTSSECPNCNRLFCAQCKVAWHSGMGCREFQALDKGERDPGDILLMELAKNQKWRRCPKCKIFVEKTTGCLHISCRCGYHFCYGCGRENNGSHACPSA